MRMYTEEELDFAKAKGICSIVFIKRVRTTAPYDAWYVIDQLEICDGYRKRTTRTYTDLAKAREDYQKRIDRMKAKGYVVRNDTES